MVGDSANLGQDHQTPGRAIMNYLICGSFHHVRLLFSNTAFASRPRFPGDSDLNIRTEKLLFSNPTYIATVVGKINGSDVRLKVRIERAYVTGDYHLSMHGKIDSTHVVEDRSHIGLPEIVRPFTQ